MYMCIRTSLSLSACLEHSRNNEAKKRKPAKKKKHVLITVRITRRARKHNQGKRKREERRERRESGSARQHMPRRQGAHKEGERHGGCVLYTHRDSTRESETGTQRERQHRHMRKGKRKDQSNCRKLNEPCQPKSKSHENRQRQRLFPFLLPPPFSSYMSACTRRLCTGVACPFKRGRRSTWSSPSWHARPPQAHLRRPRSDSCSSPALSTW